MPSCEKRTFLFVTGASYGLGRACAVTFGSHSSFMDSNINQNMNNIKSSLDIMLLARSKKGLEHTRLLINKKTKARNRTLRHKITVFPYDLSQLSILEDSFYRLIDCNSMNLYHHAIFINNVGSLGPLGSSVFNLKQLQIAINLNIISSCWLSSKFLQKYNPKLTTIVNISSICALKPFNSMSTYCMTKAARAIHHKIMAKECTHNKSLRVWNYAPGPCSTNMWEELASNNNVDYCIKKMIYTQKQNIINVIQPHDSMRKLVNLVLMDENSCRAHKFQSGDHVDYFDL